ncbi:hypothetical protein GCM10011344_20110 [Dokdonia pacifica]|nr:hypothetical protein GCM10011344_20110 [Dokdonia pacifica]
MFLIVNKYLLRKRFVGLTLWPFIIMKRVELKKDQVFINHERIHLRQQLEMLVLPFFVWYGVEYIIRLLRYRNSYKAYSNISFEREAYKNESDLHYLERRSYWSFIKYL